ncbi:DNA polymerase IV [Rhodospirillum rubrum]|uniref:DNA polymerase IV n=1 Tax=Rhodospirillum rubrum TaxID=1085 RepID=UPI001903DC56|nr:DNA polymerase IV [Rhodospirillum rubrum]MBK1663057.1 DNA polymerase IV [Rhodospirillum rubrum]MBK1677997.1 DNA polymerase IV [Rhodospirillum rubrum]
MTGLCRDCLCEVLTPSGSCPGCGSARVVRHPGLALLDIAHIDCDAFYASVEKRDNPSLRDRPLIVGHPGGRGVATTACYIARRFGARSAMPMFKCLDLCPDAVVIPPDMAKYKAVSAQVRAIMLEATHRLEPLSLDEAYLDLSEGEHRFARPPAVSLAAIARRVEREIGITVSIGLSSNRFLAKLASDMNKPQGFTVIDEAEAPALLAPMPVKRLHGVGAATERRLAELGLHTIGDLQGRPEADLLARFGKIGRALYAHAWGRGGRTISPDRETKSISAETTFERDLSRLADLAQALGPLSERVAHALSRNALAGATVVLKLKTHDFRILTRHARLGDPTARAEVIASAARRLLERESDGRRFRLIGVGMADLRPGSEADPPDLFARSPPTANDAPAGKETGDGGPGNPQRTASTASTSGM